MRLQIKQKRIPCLIAMKTFRKNNTTQNKNRNKHKNKVVGQIYFICNYFSKSGGFDWIILYV